LINKESIFDEEKPFYMAKKIHSIRENPVNSVFAPISRKSSSILQFLEKRKSSEFIV
jgi:hypothetical protein